jgi:hypothetical protein
MQGADMAKGYGAGRKGYGGGGGAFKPKKRRPFWVSLLPLGIVLAALIGGYFFWQSKQSKPTQRASCALVIDRTSSTGAAKAKYQAAASKTLEGCAARNGALTVWYFDQASSGVNVAGPFKLWGEGATRADRSASQDAAINGAREAIDGIFAAPAPDPLNGSDILNALDSVAQDLDRDASSAGVGGEKYLIVLTDGYQTAGVVTVDSLKSGESPVQPLIDRVREVGAVPVFNGAKVSFLGVGSGKIGPNAVDKTFDQKVKQFWYGVVDAGDGALCAYESASGTPLCGGS